jgi:hypothetical protein
MAAVMYIRFIVNSIDEDSGRRQGLFQASGTLRDAGLLSKHEEEQLAALHTWFNKELKEPESFSRSRKRHAKKVALSWFKDTATLYIARMHEYAAILKAHGVGIEVIRTERPGYVVYEDEFQIVAEPFAETDT